MAAPANINLSAASFQIAIIETEATTGHILTLDPDRSYSLAHLGVNLDGTTAVTTNIYFAVGTSMPDLDNDQSANRLCLKNNMAVTVGPGISKLAYKSDSGVPTFQVIASEKMLGQR